MNNRNLILPTTKQLEQELQREKYNFRYKKLLKNGFYILLLVVAISTLIATFLFPVLQIYGQSMEPTLSEDDIVVSLKSSSYKKGDVIAFYYNNRILVKRVIATSSEWINIDEDGNVFVNDKLVNEPYIIKKALGKSDLDFPYQVPEGTYFVLGDERTTSIDSRNSLIGTISSEEIIGKLIFKVWPINKFALIN